MSESVEQVSVEMSTLYLVTYKLSSYLRHLSLFKFKDNIYEEKSLYFYHICTIATFAIFLNQFSKSLHSIKVLQFVCSEFSCQTTQNNNVKRHSCVG